MIYCQLNSRVYLAPGAALTLDQLARTITPNPAGTLKLSCPDKPGIWRITPADLTPILRQRFPNEDITFMGADACYVHRTKPAGSALLKWLRTVAACAILLIGSALGLAWFHSDVDMPAAQLMVYKLITGREAEDPRLITYPYIAGVAAGVAIFYALPSRSRSTPMEVKLSAYLSSMEQTEGKDISDDS